MNAVLNQVLEGDDLARAVCDLEEDEHERKIKAKLQAALDAANAPGASTTPHKVFMAELDALIMGRLDAR